MRPWLRAVYRAANDTDRVGQLNRLWRDFSYFAHTNPNEKTYFEASAAGGYPFRLKSDCTNEPAIPSLLIPVLDINLRWSLDLHPEGQWQALDQRASDKIIWLRRRGNR